MAKPLAGHTNSYHTYSHDEALQGIAEAGYKAVELSAVPGWTEHVDLDADQGELRRKLEGYGLEPVSLSAHSDLTTADGLAHGIKAVRWAAEYGIPIVNTAVGGHQSADENEAAFLANIGAMADEAERAGIDDRRSRSTATSWPRARSRCRCSRRSGATASASTTTPRTSSTTPATRPSRTSRRSSTGSSTST